MPPAKREPIPSYGAHMTVKAFVEACKSGGFIDYDGFGNWATEKEMFSNLEVRPSDVVADGDEVLPGFKPKGTHVVWFNR